MRCTDERRTCWFAPWVNWPDLYYHSIWMFCKSAKVCSYLLKSWLHKLFVFYLKVAKLCQQFLYISVYTWHRLTLCHCYTHNTIVLPGLALISVVSRLHKLNVKTLKTLKDLYLYIIIEKRNYKHCLVTTIK